MSYAAVLSRTGLNLFYAFLVGNYFRTYHYDIYFIDGPSMAPFLSPDYIETGHRDVVLFKKKIRLADQYADEGGSGQSVKSDLQRGMIVGFLSPISGDMAVKRVVALGGDTVKPLGRNKLSKIAVEQGLVVKDHEDEVTVPFGHVWVEGDQVDKEKNIDSNSYGPISKSLIKGIGTRIIWPRHRFGPLDWEQNWQSRVRKRIQKVTDEHELPQEWALHPE